MQIASKTNGDTLSATEFNQITTELQTGLITSAGETPASGTLDQVGIAVASYAAQCGVFTIDSGAADAYVLTQVSPFKAPFALKNGLTIRFRPGNNNSGACTANAFGFGAKSIKQSDGTTDPASGDISTTRDVTLRYNLSLDVWVMASGFGTAAYVNTGTESGNVPLNSMFTGMSVYFPANTPPAGFLERNGALVSRTTYAALWAFAQASGNIAASDGAWTVGQFSPGNGSTTFRIPDSRGYFERGWANGSSIDSGRAIGSTQLDAFQGHRHLPLTASNFADLQANLWSQGGSLFGGQSATTGNPTTDTVNGTPRTASETRPINIAWLPCIKY